MATRMLQRRGTAEEWAFMNPILGDGEIGLENDTDVFKIGDGVTPWLQLEPAITEPPVTKVFGRIGEISATSSDLTDRTEVGEALFTAIDQIAARSAIGAGIGNVVGDGVLKIKVITQLDFNALPVKDLTTLYVIPGS